MRFLLIIAAAFLLAACENTPIVQEHMVITPMTVVFDSGYSQRPVSITHTCSCPFTWHATGDTTERWLVLGTNFPTTLSGDRIDLPMTIDRSKLVADTERTSLIISSNGYGTDTIRVIAVK